jgi:hypothetical protein
MKKTTLFTRAAIVGLGAVSTVQPVEAAQSAEPAEVAAYEAAVISDDMEEMQRFLATYPESVFVGSVFGRMVQKIEPPRIDRSSEAKIQLAQYEAEERTSDDKSRDAREHRRIQENPIFGITRKALRETIAATRRFESSVDRCGINDPMQIFNRCIADALDVYADELEAPAVALPEETRPAPAVIRQAAARVRSAPSRQAARAAVSEAVTEVRKSISLIRADEPVYNTLAEMQTRQGTIIAEGLQYAEAKLERAVGL